MSEKKNLNTMARGGYILLPRRLVGEALAETEEMSETQAFLCILYHACFYRMKSGERVCNRGESLYTLRRWAEIFGWKMWKTRIYLKKLEEEGKIVIVKEGKHKRLCVVGYEKWCGHREVSEVKEGQPETEVAVNKSDRLFDRFWKEYHEMVGLEPSDRYAAEQAWRKLNLEEKMEALDGITDYFWSNAENKYMKKAVNYLRDKTFLGS